MANPPKPGLHDYHAIVFIFVNLNDGSIDEHSDYILVKLAPKHITIIKKKLNATIKQIFYLFVVTLLVKHG